MHNATWRTRVAKGLVVVGSVAGVTALTGLVLILPLKAQQDMADPQTAVGDQQNCLSNMKRVAIGLFQYTSDYDERYPTGTQPTPDGKRTGVGWAGETYRYVQASAAYHCPSDGTTALRPQFGVSYGYNSNLPTLAQAAFTDGSLSVLLFEVRGDRVFLHQDDEGGAMGASLFSSAGNGTDGSLLARAGGRSSRSVVYATGLLGNRMPDTPPGQFVGGRHGGGSNFALLDGHVAYYMPDQVSSGTDASASTSPQTGGATGTAAGVDDNQFQVTFSTR